MTLDAFVEKLRSTPDSLSFEDTMAVIESLYEFTPTRFNNGNLVNESDQNNGSCKLFAFAQLQGFTPQQTLACFGRYYRDDVLGHPEGDDHQNIRQFMLTGWDGIQFETTPLKLK